jgi:RNA polymerase sigma factor (TIGR02999 family)
MCVNPPIAELVRTADVGDPDAASALFAALYRELHTIAERELRRGGVEVTLGTTTLLHEAYLNLSKREGTPFASREHFLAYACRAMRGLTIDYARRRRAKKRGGEFHLTSIPEGGVPDIEPVTPGPLEELSDALETLATVEPALAQLVDLHFFSGLSLADIAAIRHVSERTIQRDWRKARLLLHHTLGAA